MQQELRSIVNQSKVENTTALSSIESRKSNGINKHRSATPVYAIETANKQAVSVIEEALSTGTWTKENNLALLKNSENISPEVRRSLIEKLYGAINRQELEIHGEFPTL
ncbi:MAG TPA: hypothetical protein ENI97_11595 [Gammaproteobacteria bacterium]|nr:hypothetical protein [Gammaproteobacteria bacterium]